MFSSILKWFFDSQILIVRGSVFLMVLFFIVILRYLNLLPSDNVYFIILLYILSCVIFIILLNRFYKHKDKQNLEILKEDIDELQKKSGLYSSAPPQNEI